MDAGIKKPKHVAGFSIMGNCHAGVSNSTMKQDVDYCTCCNNNGCLVSSLHFLFKIKIPIPEVIATATKIKTISLASP